MRAWGFGLLALTSCAGTGESLGARDRHGIAFNLANTGALALDCRLRFGHWVDRDLGRIDPGETVQFEVSQDGGDGALYVLREDGERRMMIETIQCGSGAKWLESFGQVDLAPARAGRPGAIAAGCAAPNDGGRVTCPPVRLEE